MSFARRSPRLTLQPLEDRTTPAGALDATFGAGGRVVTSLSPGRDSASDVAVDAAGRIVVVGDRWNGTVYESFVSRYRPDGTLDPTFGPAGTGSAPFAFGPDASRATAVTLDAAGRIVVAGSGNANGSWEDFAVARFTPDGVLDPTFDGDGLLRIPDNDSADVATDVAVDAAGRIVIAGETSPVGYTRFAVLRFLPDGTPDSSFGTGGRVETDLGTEAWALGMAIDPAGRIAVVGTELVTPSNVENPVILRYTPDGALDPTFGTGGRAPAAFHTGFDRAEAVAVDAAGRLVVGGTSYGPTFALEFAVARYLPDGTLDPTFGTGGAALAMLGRNIEFGHALAIDPAGRIAVAGSTINPDEQAWSFGVARLLPDGSPDLGFGGTGAVETRFAHPWSEVAGLAVDPAGRLVAAGPTWVNVPSTYDTAIARYRNDPNPYVVVSEGDVTFVENGPPVVIDPGVLVADDGGRLAGVTVSVAPFVSGQDVLGFTPQPGIAGSFDPASGVLTFTGDAPLAAYRDLLRSVTYANTSDDPDTRPRVITFTPDDGSAAAGEPGQRTVQVQAVNDAPVLGGVPATATLAPTRTLAFTATAADPDAAGALIFSLTDAPPGAVIDPATGAFTWTPGPDVLPGVYAFTVRVTDNGTPALSDEQTVTVTLLWAGLDAGSLYVRGTAGSDVITVTPADHATVFAVKINGRSFGTFPVAAITGRIFVEALAGNDQVTVRTVPQSSNPTDAELVGGPGADTLTGGGGDDTLDGGAGNDVLAPGDGNYNKLRFADGWGVDRVVPPTPGPPSDLDFTATTAGVSVVAGVTAFPGTPADATSGANRLTIPDGRVGTIRGGSGSDKLTVTGPTHWDVAGPDFGRVNGNFLFIGVENLVGGPGQDIFDFTQATSRITGTIAGGGGPNILDYTADRDPVTVDLGRGTASRTGGIRGITAVRGGIGPNTLGGRTGPGTWTVTGPDAGQVNGVRFERFGHLVGGPAADTFAPADGAGISSVLDGGPGAPNALDYGAYTTGVTVNLGLGTATGTVGVRNIHTVRGGQAGDVLVGAFTTYPARLFGNGGRDVLIGGSGAGLVSGGAGDDLVFGGTTTHDGSPAELDAIRAEWQSSADYATRIDHLLGVQPGGLNGSVLLDPTSLVSDPGNPDTLTGGAGADWFLTQPGDSVTDREPGERRTVS